MNRTRIDWADYSWNPVTGCRNGCWYCYGKKIRKRFYPDIPYGQIICHPERFEEPFRIRKPSRIFVGSVTDLFAPWMPKAYGAKAIEVAGKIPRHTFIFLTRHPYRYRYFNFPENCWLGTTITGEENREKLESLYREITIVNGNINFISFEPLLGATYFKEFITTGNKPCWVIIGGLTGYRHVFEKSWAEEIITHAKSLGIPIFVKKNLRFPEKIMQFPAKKILERCYGSNTEPYIR